MRLDTLIRAWIDASARVLARSARPRTLVVRASPGQYSVETPAGRRVGGWPAGQAPPETLGRRLRRARLVLRLSPDAVLVRPFDLPPAGRPYAREIARSRLDRLSPWPPGRVAFGLAGAGGADGSLSLGLALVPQAVIADHVAVFAPHGLTVSSVEAITPAGPVPLERPGAPEGAAPPGWARRTAIAGAALCLASAIAGVVFAGVIAQRARAEADEARTIAHDFRQSLSGRAPRLDRPLSPEEAIWAARTAAPLQVDLLEVVTRALPDDTVLTEWRYEGGVLRLTGWSSAAPALIPALAAVPGLKDPRFFAPTVRAQDGRFRVHVETTVTRTGLGEEAP